MLRELVLNEEERKKRFAVHLAKKKREEVKHDRTANNPTRFTEQNMNYELATSVVEPIHSTSSQSSIEFSSFSSTTRAVMCPSQTSASPSSQSTKTNSLYSICQENTPLSSRLDQYSSLSSRFEPNTYLSSGADKNTSLPFGSKQNTSLSSGFGQNKVSMPAWSTPDCGLVHSLIKEETPPDASDGSPYQNMPPLKPVRISENFSPISQQSSRQHTNLYADRESNLSIKMNSLNDWKPEMHDVKVRFFFRCKISSLINIFLYVKIFILKHLKNTFYEDTQKILAFSHSYPGSRESVITKLKRIKPAKLKETCGKVIRDKPGSEKNESEGVIDKTDQELSVNSTENDICGDGLILEYLHKKFGIKKRESAPVVKNKESIELEAGSLEGTELLNR